MLILILLYVVPVVINILWYGYEEYKEGKGKDLSSTEFFTIMTPCFNWITAFMAIANLSYVLLSGVIKICVSLAAEIFDLIFSKGSK